MLFAKWPNWFKVFGIFVALAVGFVSFYAFLIKNRFFDFNWFVALLFLLSALFFLFALGRFRRILAANRKTINKAYQQLQLLREKNEQLVQQEELRKSTQEEKAEAEKQEFLEKVEAYIMKNLDNPKFGVRELCEEMRISNTVLYMKLVQYTNKSGNEFIKWLRMQEAKEMLLDGKLSVSEVAYSVGFSDPKYFSKCFKKQYGVSPSAFKRL